MTTLKQFANYFHVSAPGSIPVGSTPAPILNIPAANNTTATANQQQKDAPVTRPQGKAMPIMSTSAAADPFRQILPKNVDVKMQSSSTGAVQANVRPMQVKSEHHDHEIIYSLS